jgi:hypothetical protein
MGGKRSVKMIWIPTELGDRRAPIARMIARKVARTSAQGMVDRISLLRTSDSGESWR